MAMNSMGMRKRQGPSNTDQGIYSRHHGPRQVAPLKVQVLDSSKTQELIYLNNAGESGLSFTPALEVTDAEVDRTSAVVHIKVLLALHARVSSAVARGYNCNEACNSEGEC